MLAAGVVENGHAEARVGALGKRHPDTPHTDDAEGFMVHIVAKPVRTDAFGPLAGLHAVSHFNHPTRGAQYQRHNGIGDGFGQYGRGVHQQHFTRIQRIDVEIIVADGNGRSCTKLGHFLQ